MKFIDEVVISVQSGRGGPGSISWRREKYVPRGGPDGGDGGKGGDVIFRVNTGLNSLLDYHFKKVYAAQDGARGGAMLMTGKSGDDLVLEVPPGTIVKDSDGETLIDLGDRTDDHVFLKGGRGGKGNHFFKTSVNQAPKFAQPGEPGEKQDIKLELKLLADVGIVGFPNAGKSTLISHISAAKPKIADYPFTTLTPSLGVVRMDEERTYVVADIPGLIPGAHKGVGLGIKFLKHIQRTRIFIHLIDASELSGRDPVQDYEDINTELRAYDEIHVADSDFEGLSKRPQLVVLNKIDSVDKKRLETLQKQFAKKGVTTRAISAATGQGLQELIFEVGRKVFEKDSQNSENP